MCYVLDFVETISGTTYDYYTIHLDQFSFVGNSSFLHTFAQFLILSSFNKLLSEWNYEDFIIFIFFYSTEKYSISAEDNYLFFYHTLSI